MAGLLNLGKTDDAPDEGRPTTAALYVRGTRFDNTAAKFWPSLIDEVFEAFPARPVIELSAPASGPLGRRHLFPELEMQREMDRMLESGETMEDVLAELDMTGPPAPVRIRLLRGGEAVLDQVLPDDCLDAETFPCLVAWLLEWGGIPTSGWDGPRQKGVFAGDDRGRKRGYLVSFTVVTDHVKEGLCQRTVTIAAAMTPAR
jgi:hypothetical protein